MERFGSLKHIECCTISFFVFFFLLVESFLWVRRQDREVLYIFFYKSQKMTLRWQAVKSMAAIVCFDQIPAFLHQGYNMCYDKSFLEAFWFYFFSDNTINHHFSTIRHTFYQERIVLKYPCIL